MTVIQRDKDCILIQHNRQIYNYQNKDGNISRFQLKEILFKNFKRKGKCKQSSNRAKLTEPALTDTDTTTETSIRCKVETFLANLKRANLFSYQDETSIDTIKAENFALTNNFYAESSRPLENFHGENNLDYGKIVSIGDVNFLIPPKCRFFNKSIENLSSILDQRHEANKFDFVVIDPPWQNRYIKRVKKRTEKLQGYQTMSDEEIAEIPLANYLSKNSIVAVWCTNSESHIKSFKSEICNCWNLKLLSTWLWMKIDSNGELFNDFNGNKRPYERIFIATTKENCELDGKLEEELVIFSQPSAIHSHKPPLIDLFLDFLPKNPRCLEMFARNLNENFTSIGLEVLKLQNVMLFDELS